MRNIMNNKFIRLLRELIKEEINQIGRFGVTDAPGYAADKIYADTLYGGKGSGKVAKSEDEFGPLGLPGDEDEDEDLLDPKMGSQYAPVTSK